MNHIFSINNEEDFLKGCIDTFNFQYNYNPVYRHYVDLLGVRREDVSSIEKIPFLPIRLFKSQRIISSADPAVEVQKIFTSSATTGMVPSKHFVTDLSLYRESFLRGFREFYGDPSEWVILALLPSYLEREGSSLVFMADELIKASGKKESGFFLYNHEELYKIMADLRSNGRKVLLLGVTFALLDAAAKFSLPQSSSDSLVVMETGGMKGRGEELSREEVHRRMKASFGVAAIHSEYGMCELLSQAYSSGEGRFTSPRWMRVVLRDFIDSSKIAAAGDNIRGGINVIDLANIYSCSFIETEDMGTLFVDGSFSVDGRLGKSERRGCNMLLE